MSTLDWLAMDNASARPWKDVPRLALAEFHDDLAQAVDQGCRVAALFGHPVDGRLHLVGVLAAPQSGQLRLAHTEVGDEYPALTPDCPAVHLFEREIAEQWGVVPLGHPLLRPVRFHRSQVEGKDAWGRGADTPILPAVMDFFAVHGPDVHEVAVGPIHAGVIEPGHFRFQCHGEVVLHLEIALGFQHRGIERALVGGPNKRTPSLIETAAGDTTIAHATAHAEIVEALAGVETTTRARTLRSIALELERLANHVGDLGALAGDVGFLPTSSHCGRLRGDFLNATASLCGSRFGRSFVVPGGVRFDVDDIGITQLVRSIARAEQDVVNTLDLLWSSPSVLARFELVGAIAGDDARALGMVGVAARACGLDIDVRHQFPTEAYREFDIKRARETTGDVAARAHVRSKEIGDSVEFVLELASHLDDEPVWPSMPVACAGNHVAVAMVEGWRGELCHVAMTDDAGRFARYKIVDPSFHNWSGLALALRKQQISDFPLCNKSFNLSYCGHDL